MTSRMTGPRRLPTWTVPEGVFESLTTCGPSTEAASSSAQSIDPSPSTCHPQPAPGTRLPRAAATLLRVTHPPGSADLDDRVGEVAGGDADDDLLALLLAQERPSDRRFVRDPAL